MKGFYNRMVTPKKTWYGNEWGSSFVKRVSHKKVRQKLKVNVLDAVDEVQDEYYDNEDYYDDDCYNEDYGTCDCGW